MGRESESRRPAGGSQAGSLLTLLLVPWVPVVLFSCGPSPTQATAELLTALATKIPLGSIASPNPSASPGPSVTLPPQISCNSDVFTLDTSGSFSVIGTITGTTADVVLNTNLNVTGSGFGQGGTVGTTTSSGGNVLCNVPAVFTFDPVFFGLKGSGSIPGCDHYDCIVNGAKIDCGDLQTAMSSLTCY